MNFTSAKQLREQKNISEITQWRDRFPKGPLEYYRISGRIYYSDEQLDKYFEAKRVGAKSKNSIAVATK